MVRNPKLHKERIRTSSQRPDIVIAFQNLLRQNPALSAVANASPEAGSLPRVKRSA